MTLSGQKVFRQNRSVFFLYFLAFCNLLMLVSFSRPDVFYSGDGGLKFMMIRQICAGEDFRYVSHTQPRWVEDIWSQGFFPMRKSFVFPGPKGIFFVFSPPFQIISAFFYRHLGYRGLYFIPSVSLLLFWYWFIWLTKKMAFTSYQVAILFFILAFCSPLTLYGALYWEHTLGMLLLFAGVVMIEYPPRKAWQAGVLGCMSGLAIWVRPEMLLLNVLFACALLALHFKRFTLSHWLFIVGGILGTVSFLVFNKVEYGYFFGIHGWQVLGDVGYFSKFRRTAGNIYRMNVLLVRYFSIILLLIPVLVAWLKFKWPLPRRTVAMVLISLLFWLFSPFLFPDDGGKQWGPRFFLPLMPMVLLVLARAYQEWKKYDWARYKLALLVFVCLAGGYDLFLNTFKGAASLQNDYANRIRPSLDYVRKEPGKIVVVNSHFVTMELSSVFRDKYFFLVDDTMSLHKLMPLLENKGEDHFTYVNFDHVSDEFRTFLSMHHTKLIDEGSYQVAEVGLE
jgi:hypothetical protein